MCYCFAGVCAGVCSIVCADVYAGVRVLVCVCVCVCVLLCVLVQVCLLTFELRQHCVFPTARCVRVFSLFLQERGEAKTSTGHLPLSPSQLQRKEPS